MITASSLERISLCPGSEALPHASRANEHNEAGSVLHKYLEDCSTMGASTALERVPAQHQEACAILALEDLPAGKSQQWASEVTFAWNVETFEARELGRNLGRRYGPAGLHHNEIAGTADCIGLTDDAVVVADYKFGYKFVEPSSLQMKFLGMAAAQAYGKDTAYVVILRVRDGEVTRHAAKLDAMDFGAIAHEIAAIERRAINATAKDDLHAGPWCRWCPALSFCPAQGYMVKLLANDTNMALTAADMAAALTPDKAAKAWCTIKAAKAAIELVEDAVRLFASQTPIDLPGGKALGMVTRESERIDGGVALTVLRGRIGNELADTAVTMEVSKTAIKDAVRTFVAQHPEPKPKMAAVEREIMDGIRSLGGARVSKSTSVREHSVKGKE